MTRCRPSPTPCAATSKPANCPRYPRQSLQTAELLHLLNDGDDAAVQEWRCANGIYATAFAGSVVVGGGGASMIAGRYANTTLAGILVYGGSAFTAGAVYDTLVGDASVAEAISSGGDDAKHAASTAAVLLPVLRQVGNMVLKGGRCGWRWITGRAPKTGPAIRNDVALSGGRSGQNVKNLTGPPNSAVRGADGRVYVTNDKGQVILDITRDRVKPVTPGQGFGPKRPPTPDELELINKVHGGGAQ